MSYVQIAGTHGAVTALLVDNAPIICGQSLSSRNHQPRGAQMALRTVWLTPAGHKILIVGPFGMECSRKYDERGEYDFAYSHTYWPTYKKWLRKSGYRLLGDL